MNLARLVAAFIALANLLAIPAAAQTLGQRTPYPPFPLPLTANHCLKALNAFQGGDAGGDCLTTASIILPANGGTGIANNNASTLTLSGAFATTLTLTGATSLTLPTSGTLMTTATGVTCGQLPALTGGVTSSGCAATVAVIGGTTVIGSTGTVKAVFDTAPTLINPVVTGTIDSASYTVGGTHGADCSGAPTAGFTVVKGIVTAC